MAEEILACPVCKGGLKYLSIRSEDGSLREILVCEKCRVSYRIEDGIPVLLIEEAQKTS